MTRTTHPPAYGVAARFPALAAYARVTVRLHPRRGNPTAYDSHLGGPLLWPADEPWPRCGRPKCFIPAPEQPEPAVVAGQFWARDLPDLPFPAGTDLLQVLWCPHEHDELQGGIGPYVYLFWRNSHSITPSSEPPPEPMLLNGDDSLVPRPCVLHPERLTEYPWHEELPADLAEAVQSIREEYREGLSIAPGSKIGGWVSWAVTDRIPQPCLECGTPTEHLLSIADTEWGSRESRWRPFEEDALGDRDAWNPIGTYIKDAVRLFVCPQSTDHPVRFDRQ
ncbi:hypothetical protein N8J89_23265 [Crossiella sp. CA-258035]|uniref:hypothetical protein n=1 Tax=Crossiella sp. CA-258035 TaxID=2981138 RepID=UPI0024BD56C1|nr:hypothetical protein [Crossiella sp. CA-258035]WHT16051.1 hypothetical protein N8J89_23265 [Crossiella sp. CA-258035]